MQLLKALKSKIFLTGLSLWLIATFSYFLFIYQGLTVSPIAIDGLQSLLTIYMPVLVLAVFLLLYLTRKREAVNWAELYAVKKSSAKKEAWLSLMYLIITQLILGAGFNMGLHFPGTDVYSTGSQSQVDVWVWACLLYTSPSPRDRQNSRMPSSA